MIREYGDEKKVVSYDRDVQYWNDYYRSAGVEKDPSLFAINTLDELKMREGGIGRILELGCGNGRDSLFFAANGLHVTGVDASEQAINQLNADCQGKNVHFICGDFVKSEKIYSSEYEYVYSRFSIHAIFGTTARTLG